MKGIKEMDTTQDTANSPEPKADWSLTTGRGSRLRKHREFAALHDLDTDLEADRFQAVTRKLASAEKDIQEGRILSHLEAKKRLSRWLKK
jgi:hypothetical protein